MEVSPEGAIPSEPNPNAGPPPHADAVPVVGPSKPKVEGVVWSTGKSVVRDWISPEDIKPVKGYEAWHQAMYVKGSDGKDECQVAAIDGAIIRLKIKGEVTISSSKPVVIKVKPSQSGAEAEDLPFHIEKSTKLTLEVAKKVLFLLHMRDLKLRPIYIKEDKLKELEGLIVDATPA